MKKHLLIISLAFLFTGCSSVELEEGPGVEEIYFSEAGTNANSNRIKLLRDSLIPNPRFSISDPLMPVIRPPFSFPVYVRGKRERYYQEQGRWTHEIIDMGGYIND